MRGGYDLVVGHISPISQPPSPPGNYCIVPRFGNFTDNFLSFLHILRLHVPSISPWTKIERYMGYASLEMKIRDTL